MRVVLVVAAVGLAFLSPRAGVLRADTILLNDSLTDPSGCGPWGGEPAACAAGRTARGAGEFTPDGWRQAADAMLAYDLGEGVDCATLTFSVTGWDPRVNMIGMDGEDDYHDVLSLFEGDHGDPRVADANFETQSLIQIVGQDVEEDRENRYKLNAYAVAIDGCSECGGWTWSGPYEWDVTHVYRWEFRWNSAQVVCTVADESGGTTHESSVSWAFPAVLPDPGIDRAIGLRFLFLGANHKWGGKPIQGPVYSDLRLVRDLPCDGSCGGPCADGVQDCGEEGIDCGGPCTPCSPGGDADADAEPPEAGPDGTGDGPDAAGADSPLDGPPDADVLAAEPGGGEAGGCGCRAAGAAAERRGLLAVCAVLLLAVRSRRGRRPSVHIAVG